MTRNGMFRNCTCRAEQGNTPDLSLLQLLSQIPNQKVYRCKQCHTFYSYTEDCSSWEVIMQGDLDGGLRDLCGEAHSPPATA